MIVQNLFMKDALKSAKEQRENLKTERDYLLQERVCGNAVLLLNEQILVLDGKIEALREVIAEAKRYKVVRTQKKLAVIAAEQEAAAEEAAKADEKEEEKKEADIEEDVDKIADEDTDEAEDTDTDEEEEEEKKEVEVKAPKKTSSKKKGTKKKNSKK